jgi:NSS family neurotransmitter:Na+ symporter
VGLGTVMSLGAWENVTFNSLTGLNWEFVLFNQNFFDATAFIATNLMLPLGAFLLAVFCAWVLRDQNTAQELGMPESGIAYKSWHWSMRLLTPMLVVVALLHAVNIL